MKENRILTIAAAFGMLLAIPASQATLFFEADFEDPPYATGNVIGQEGWASAYGPGAADFLVTSGGGVHPLASTGDQYLRVTYKTAASAVTNTFATSAVTDPFQVSLNIAWGGTSVPTAMLRFFVLGPISTNFQGARIGFGPDAATGFFRLVTMTSSTSVFLGPADEDVPANTWYRCVLDFRPAESKYDVFVYDMGGALIDSVTNLTARGSETSFNKFNIDMGSTAGTSFYIDDIQIIPEPGSLALLGLGAAIALFRRRRARR